MICRAPEIAASREWVATVRLLLRMSKSRKEPSHDSHDPTRGVYRNGEWPTTDVDGTGATAMEAGVHHGRGTTPAPAHALDRRVESIAGGDRRRQAAVSAPCRRAGDQLLRGRAGRVLDPPVPHQSWGRKSCGGFVEHRGESTRPARQ